MNAVRRIRWTVLLLALLAMAPGASAQTRLSIVGGPSFNELGGSGAENDAGFGSRTGMHISVNAIVPLLGQWVSVAPGAMYVDKGHTYDAGAAAVKLSYLEVEPLLRLAVPIGSAFNLVAFGGPGFALSFGCVLKLKPEEEEIGVVERTFECSNDELGFKGTDITAIVGAGIEIPLNPRLTLLLHGAYDKSLRSIDSTGIDADLRNQSWLVGAGVSFPLARR